jgi:tetratricopeptide (TPR) repeat protein
LRLTPDDPLAHLELGTIKAKQGRFTEALAQLQEATRLQPGMVEAYLELGRVYRFLGRTEESRAAYRKAVELKPDQISALYVLARNPQDQRESAELFGRIRELQSRTTESGKADDANGAGVRLVADGRFDEALAAFRRALEENPSFALAAYNMGVVLAQKGQMPEAAEAFRTAIRLRPGLSAAHFGLGLVLLALGDPSAEEELRNARTLDDLAGQESGKNSKPLP